MQNTITIFGVFVSAPEQTEGAKTSAVNDVRVFHFLNIMLFIITLHFGKLLKVIITNELSKNIKTGVVTIAQCRLILI